MITEEQLSKIVTQVTQEAWRSGTNTTLNDTVAFILKQSLVNAILPELENLYDINEALNERIVELEENDDKEQLNASKEGGLQKSRGRPKAA